MQVFGQSLEIHGWSCALQLCLEPWESGTREHGCHCNGGPEHWPFLRCVRCASCASGSHVDKSYPSVDGKNPVPLAK